MTYIPAPYATADEYIDYVGRLDQGDNTLIDSYILGISRIVDGRTGVVDGMWGPISGSQVFIFEASGGTLLRLRDDEGRQYFLRGVTADKIEIDTELDGTFDDYAYDFADLWVRGYPINALSMGRAFTAIELLPNRTGSTLSTWPTGRALVQVTSTTWGCAQVPWGIKERVIGIVKEMVQVNHGGPSVDIATDMEANIGARSLMNLIEQEYRHRIPVLF